MLSNRVSTGLGYPPTPYCTNAVESINHLLKLRTDFIKQEVTTFIYKLKELVDSQFAEIDGAVAGMGDYKKFSFASAKWFSLSEDQKQRALKRFQSVLPANKDVPDPDAFSSSAGNSMSAFVEDNPLAALGIPRYIADTIWQ